MMNKAYERYAPVEAANKINVSTTTLRRYEEQGLIPDVPRTPSNRRWYTERHMQAFVAIRALLRAFEIPAVYDVMRLIKHSDIDSALWLLNRELYDAQTEKHRVEDVLSMLRSSDLAKYDGMKIKDSVTIGEAARMANVNASAIRHWEQEGLIVSTRHPANGYRFFSRTECRKILLISSLRKTVYYIDNMKQLLNELEVRNLEQTERSFKLVLQKLNDRLYHQFSGIAQLMAYIELYKETQT